MFNLTTFFAISVHVKPVSLQAASLAPPRCKKEIEEEKKQLPAEFEHTTFWLPTQQCFAAVQTKLLNNFKVVQVANNFFECFNWFLFSLKTTGTGGPVFGALKYAGRLPFRSGVSKSVVLITCNPGTDGSFYGDAMTMLTEQVSCSSTPALFNFPPFFTVQYMVFLVYLTQS